jgi:hypothetical protein
VHGRFHLATGSSHETFALQGFCHLLCPHGPALYTAVHDS